MLIPKTTNSQLVDEMIGINLEELNFITTQNSARKWFAQYTRSEPDLLKREKPIDYLRAIPKEWCEILNQQCRLCPVCKNCTKNEKHMEEQHGIEILSYQDIWDAIKTTYNIFTEKQKKKNPLKKVKREVFLNIWKPKLQKIKEIIDTRLKQLFIQPP